jgi:hypothetical protein
VTIQIEAHRLGEGLETGMGCSERKKEIRRRRHRRKKVSQFKGRLTKASVSEKTVIAAKLRDLTPGAETIIETLQLEER